MLYDGKESAMKLLAIGLVLGLLFGYFLSVTVLQLPSETASKVGSQFVGGIGLGLGGVAGLIAMIWLLKTCDRLFAEQSRKNSKG
jgi:hypothetical protein